MAETDSQVPQNKESLAPPPLGPELASGKWKVRVIDVEAKITDEIISGKQVWSMFDRRVMVEFNSRGQPIKDSGGLFGTWLGSLSHDGHLLPIYYTDWRKVPSYKKDMAWKVIQKKFWFDNPKKRKKYVLSSLGARCKDLKQRLWKDHRRNTVEESIKERPALIPEDQWRHFVHIQFTEKAKKMRERNIKNRSKLKMLHALGKKSLARKANEMQEETGKEPNRGELFIASRTRLDGSFICNEARICMEKLKEAMDQNIQNEDSSSDSGPKDAFERVFGPEHSGRVRCVGRGQTPSKYFQSLESQAASNSEIAGIKSHMKGLEDKLDIVANALQILISNNQFQASTMSGNTIFNINLHQTSSVSTESDFKDMDTKRGRF